MKSISYKEIEDRFTCVAFVETSYSNTDRPTCKFESSQSEESRASDASSPNFWRCQIFWLSARNSVLFDTIPLEAQNEKICQMWACLPWLHLWAEPTRLIPWKPGAT